MIGKNGIEQHPCPSPDLCSLNQGGLCKPYRRLYGNFDGSVQSSLEPLALIAFVPKSLDFVIIKQSGDLHDFHAIAVDLKR
ncbi:hypothetical protein I9192_14710 [Acinetobacter bereziniae]|nr:hypothetical protein I9192_14710 [Acinetobacter bereziniae]QQC83589.1 hypothetical protein I9190_15015 [Acinetobacter bereziniae]